MTRADRRALALKIVLMLSVATIGLPLWLFHLLKVLLS